MQQNQNFRYESRYQTLFPLPCALSQRKVQYEHLNVEEIKELFYSKNSQKNHPRILASAKDFSVIQNNIKTDERAKQYLKDVLQKADLALEEPVIDHPDRHIPTMRITLLSLAYQLTKEEKYAKRAWQEMERMCSFSTWMPDEKLDMGYILKGIAIGYDWLYEYLNDIQREVVRTAILCKSFWIEREVFRTPDRAGLDAHNIYQNTNHNVSINCGLILAACAIFDEEDLSDICGEILEGALWALENYLPEFFEHGAGKEGIYYWYWPMESADEIMSTLQATFDTTFGLAQTPGIEKTGYFPIYMTGSTGYGFNWGNGHPALAYHSHEGTQCLDNTGEIRHPEVFISADLFHLAKILNLPELGYARIQTIEKYHLSATPYDLLWYRPLEKESYDLANDAYFERTESVGMFSDWKDTQGLSVCLKGGFNNEVHGSLNTGSFILDAMGERWACLLGSERYSVPNYWDYSANGTRWTYYRMRAEGQNALVLNPGIGPDQYPLAYSKVIHYESTPNSCVAIVDGTPAFEKDASIHSVKRGMGLINQRSEAVLQDEVKADDTEYWWFMQTMADITVLKNGKYAVLCQHGKYMHIVLNSNREDAVFQVMEAKALPSGPKQTQNSENAPCKKLVIHVSQVEDLTINLRFIPSKEKETSHLEGITPVELF